MNIGIVTIDGETNQATISISGPYPVKITGGVAAATITLGMGGAKTVLSSDGFLAFNDKPVLKIRKPAVPDAPTGANEAMAESDWAGTDCVSLTALNNHLNAVDAYINKQSHTINELLLRLRPDTGHGLIDK